jgi:hypothetical protein
MLSEDAPLLWTCGVNIIIISIVITRNNPWIYVEQQRMVFVGAEMPGWRRIVYVYHTVPTYLGRYLPSTLDSTDDNKLCPPGQDKNKFIHCSLTVQGWLDNSMITNHLGIYPSQSRSNKLRKLLMIGPIIAYH